MMVRIFVCLVVGILLSLLLEVKSYGHDWYPIDCCSDRDCMAIPDDAVKVTAEGYVIKLTGELIAWDDPRLRFTPEETESHFHWCRRLEDARYAAPGSADPVYRKNDTVCLFAPPGGV